MDKNINGKWMHSYSEESFTSSDYYDTKEEAIKAGKEEYKNDEICFYVGKVKEYIPRINAEWAIEHIQDDAYENYDDVAEDYLADVTKEMSNELDEKLNDVFQEWLTKYNLHPTFYGLVCVECVEIESEGE